MAKLRSFNLALLFSLSLLTLRAQDVLFSQPQHLGLYYNPSLAGVNGGPQFTLAYRNQWPGLQNAFATYYFSYDQPIDAFNSGIGVTVMNDQQGNGLFSKTVAHAIYAYHLSISEKWGAQFGFEGGIIQNHLNSSQLVFGENIDPQTGEIISGESTDLPDMNNRMLADFGAGFSIFSDHLLLNAAAHHLTQPDESFNSNLTTPLPLLWNGQVAYKFFNDANAEIYFLPYAMFMMQRDFQAAFIGADVGIHAIGFGIAYRTTFQNASAIVFNVGFHKDIFSFAYSYDASISSLKTPGSGAHELVLQINLSKAKNYIKREAARRSVQCPDLF